MGIIKGKWTLHHFSGRGGRERGIHRAHPAAPRDVARETMATQLSARRLRWGNMGNAYRCREREEEREKRKGSLSQTHTRPHTHTRACIHTPHVHTGILPTHLTHTNSEKTHTYTTTHTHTFTYFESVYITRFVNSLRGQTVANRMFCCHSDVCVNYNSTGDRFRSVQLLSH